MKLQPNVQTKIQFGIALLAKPCLLLSALAATNLAQACVTADVVALDQVLYYNRLGAMNPLGMIYALKRDVVAITGTTPSAGNAMLRPGKRPRPLVLSVNEDDCLTVNFTNWLSPTLSGSLQAPIAPSSPDPNATPVKNDDGPATRTASFHVLGMQAQGIQSDSSYVGNNTDSLAKPDETKTYTFYAQKEGTYFAYSTAATTGGEGNGGSLAFLTRDVLGGPLVYNYSAGLEDPGAILYVRDTDFDKKTNLLKRGVSVEPLILRARAGDCITLDLVNHLPADLCSTQADGYSTLPMIVEGFNNNDILPSSYTGLTPQLLDRCADQRRTECRI